jgi:peptidoglycan/LPS O-acetylase OafA/YrhL
MRSTNYRADIDGLRAISVLAVVFFHAGFPLFSGGYIGVDIFFVISGFLITSLILKEYEAGTFSMFHFWERRARRILPALFIVLAASSIAAQIALWPIPLREFAGQLMASLVFAANFAMAGAVDYFTPQAANAPLSHLWSLAVEEQFYLLFPIILLTLLKGGRKLTYAALSLFLIFSLLFAQWSGNIRIHPPYLENELLWYAQSAFSGFYLPIGRAWELLVGGLLAFHPNIAKQLSGKFRNFLAISGLMIIVICVVAFDGEIPTPSVYTLLPVIGAALLITCGNSNGTVQFLLTRRPVIFIGLISYSLYLWHQPLFAFVRSSYSETLEWWFYVALILISIALSYLSWRFVEQPCRDLQRVKNKAFISTAIAAMIGFFLFGGIAFNTGGIPNATPQERYLLALDPQKLGSYVSTAFESSKMPFDTATSQPKVLVVGDSQGQDFYNVISESNWLPGHQLRALSLDNVCSAYFIPNPERWVTSIKDQNLCTRQKIQVLTSVNLRQADILFFAMSWMSPVANNINLMLENLDLRDDQIVFIVGHKYFGKIDLKNYFGKSLPELQKFKHKISQAHAYLNQTLSQLPSQAFFLNPVELVCGEKHHCRQFTPKGQLISYDGGHLTRDGAKLFAKKIFSIPIMREIERNFSGKLE